MTVIGLIIAVVSVLGSVSAKEPVNWGVAILLVAICFRMFWRLAIPHKPDTKK